MRFYNLMNKYKDKEVVWAKLQGHPWWPAYINQISEESCEIIYFGDFSVSFLSYKKIKPFD